MSYIKIYKDRIGEFRFRIKTNNQEIIATGEGYKQKNSVHQALKIILGLDNNTRIEDST